MTDLTGILTPGPSAFIAQNDEEQGILDRYAARGYRVVGTDTAFAVGQVLSKESVAWTSTPRIIAAHPWIVTAEITRHEYETAGIRYFAAKPWMTHFYRIAVAD
jgi:hypothetical protein